MSLCSAVVLKYFLYKLVRVLVWTRTSPGPLSACKIWSFCCLSFSFSLSKISTPNEDVGYIIEWCSNDNMVINTKKSCSMLAQRLAHQDVTRLSIKINNDVITLL